MIWTEDQSEPACSRHAAIDTRFVEVGTEQIDSVGAAEFVRPVSIDVANTRPIGFFNDRSDLEVILHILPELKWNAVRVDKSKVGDACLELLTHDDRFRKALLEKSSQP